MESCETCKGDCAPTWRAKVKGGCVYHRPKSAVDVVTVVRCKGCLAYESADGFCYVHADHMTEDDFCSRGTKRE